jgi:surface carbohydrate biosynthesis protein
MFVFGRAVGTLYSKYISGEIVPIGSFKNNSVPISATESKSIAYVSTYRPGISKDFVVPDSSPSNPVTYQQITARRERVIIYVAEYCKKHQKQFVIVGKDEDFSEENLYYQKLLENYPWKLEPRLTSMNSYEVLNKSEIVVFTSSTLGYEALARGKKTAAFLIDAKLLDAQALRFGWPAVVADEGKFWTHQLEEKRFAEILDYLTSVSDSDWEKVRAEAMHEIINFDPGNSQFVEMVQSLRADW